VQDDALQAQAVQLEDLKKRNQREHVYMVFYRRVSEAS